MRISSLLPLSVLALCAGTLAAPAQDLSVEELTRLFERQKEVFSEAQTNGMGKTRGLTLVTVEDAGANAATGATVTADTGTATIATPTAADPNKPLVFGKLDKELQVNLQITFGFDSAALAPEEKPKLQKMCQVLQSGSINLMRIVGHTDTSGSAAYNENLSILRAQEVARHLVEDCGIAPSRLETVGMGERYPYNTENPRADENRRVEFQALS